jgi:hypothetical protein
LSSEEKGHHQEIAGIEGQQAKFLVQVVMEALVQTGLSNEVGWALPK